MKPEAFKAPSVTTHDKAHHIEDSDCERGIEQARYIVSRAPPAIRRLLVFSSTHYKDSCNADLDVLPRYRYQRQRDSYRYARTRKSRTAF
jgi:hypothetical protein